MRWTWMILLLTGLGAIALGALWFLQGSDLVHIQPVLCAADCEPVVGHQPVWQVAGAVAILTGALASFAALRKLRR